MEPISFKLALQLFVVTWALIVFVFLGGKIDLRYLLSLRENDRDFNDKLRENDREHFERLRKIDRDSVESSFKAIIGRK